MKIKRFFYSIDGWNGNIFQNFYTALRYTFFIEALYTHKKLTTEV